MNWSNLRTPETVDPWAFAVPRLTPFGLARLREDYANRDRILPERTGGARAIGREDFAAGWIAHAQRCGANTYLK